MIWRHRSGGHAVEVWSKTAGFKALVAFTHEGVRLLSLTPEEHTRDWRAVESDEVRAAYLMASAARYVGCTEETWEALASVVQLPEEWRAGALALGEVRSKKEEKAAKKAAKKPRKKKPQKEAVPDEEDHSAGVSSGEW